MSIHQSIESKLQAALKPARLSVINESHLHAHHAGAAQHAKNHSGANGETHFRIAVESDAFSKLGKVARHRMVYEILEAEIAAGVHALALETAAPGE